MHKLVVINKIAMYQQDEDPIEVGDKVAFKGNQTVEMLVDMIEDQTAKCIYYDEKKGFCEVIISIKNLVKITQ